MSTALCPTMPLDEETMKFAKKLAAGPIISYKNIKRQIYAAAFAEYQHYLENIEVPCQRECAPDPGLCRRRLRVHGKTASPFYRPVRLSSERE